MAVMKLLDGSVMPFGAYKGKTMEQCPARYLLYLWNDGIWDAGKLKGDRLAVHEYIKEAMSALEQEDKNTIVEHRP